VLLACFCFVDNHNLCELCWTTTTHCTICRKSKVATTTMQSELGEGMIGFVSTDNKVVVVKQKLVIDLAPRNEKLVNDSACALNVPINLSTLEDFVVFLGLYSNFDSKTKQPERKGNPIVSTPMWDFLETRPEGELVYFLKAALNLKMEKLYDFAARIGYACGTRNPRRDGMPGSARPKLNREVNREGCTKCGGCVLERKYKVYEELYGDVNEKARQRAKEIEDFENSFV